MNQSIHFSWHRFALCFRKEIRENKKKWVWRAVSVYGILALLLVINYSYTLYLPTYYWEQNIFKELVQSVILTSLQYFFIMFLFFGAFSSSQMMEGMNRKTSRILLLMTPATSFEKYITRWLLSVFLCLPFLLVLFQLADLTRYFFTLCFFSEHYQVPPFTVWHYLIEGEHGAGACESVVQCFCITSFVLFIHSLFALGSTLWTRQVLTKTFAAVFILLVLYVGFSVLLFTWIIDEETIVATPSFVQDWEEKHVCLLISLFCWLGMLFHWVLGYYRFKESEIINRW